MSLQLQNDVARRLRRGTAGDAITASALFGRSCRLLDQVGERDRISAVHGPIATRAARPERQQR